MIINYKFSFIYNFGVLFCKKVDIGRNDRSCRNSRCDGLNTNEFTSTRKKLWRF